MPEPKVQYGFREDLYNVTLTVEAENKKVVIPIDKMTGGAVQGKSTKHRPSNGLENEMGLGGPKSVSNATLTTLQSQEIEENLAFLLGFAGRANIILSKQPIDENGKAFGKVLTYEGKLLDVTPSPTDSESEKTANIEFTVSLKSAPTVQ